MPAICELSWQCAGQIALFQLKMNFVRYYPIAGLAFLIFWVWKKGYFQRFKIQQAFPRSERIRYEILQSAVTLSCLHADWRSNICRAQSGLPAR
jgi:lathosterol oxidase